MSQFKVLDAIALGMFVFGIAVAVYNGISI